MNKSKFYIRVSVETPPERKGGVFSEDVFLIDRTGDICTGYYSFNSDHFFVYNDNGQVPTHYLRPVENVYVMDEAAIIELMAFTISKQSMKSYDHCRRMAKEYFEIVTKPITHKPHNNEPRKYSI